MTENTPGHEPQPDGQRPPYQPAPSYPPQGPGGAGQNRGPGQNPAPSYAQPGMPQPYPQAPYQQPGKQGNGFGVAALVLGILALVSSFIPFLGVVAFILGPLAILFGILGLVLRKQAPKGTSITGMILGGVGILVAVVVTMLTAVFVAQVGSAYESARAESSKSQEAESSAQPSSSAVAGGKVEFIATTNKGEADATYSVGGDSAQKKFSGEFKANGTMDPTFDIATLVVLGDPLTDGQTVSCEIKVDGKTVKKQSGSTAVSCTITSNH
ncbi:hypothetical protein [Arthrobacter sp. NPDC090010]|uniref:DUF308 domain-containing protein n=1 Tax=Arthrobacter sp. NPDC090010 TaxID=3363942 RepID=UPI003817BDB4